MHSRILRRLGRVSALTGIGVLTLGVAPAMAAVEVELFANEDGSSISIEGDAAADTVSVSLANGTITVTNPAGATRSVDDTHCTEVSPTTVTCPADPADPPAPAPATAPVDSIDAFLGGGDDSFTTNAFRTFVGGGDGADTLNGGPERNRLFGNDGNDPITGGPQNDLLTGGDGDDVLGGGIGSDSLAGDAGNDYADGGPGPDGVSGGLGNDNVLGGDGNDFLSDDPADGLDDGEFGGFGGAIRQAAPTFGTDNVDGQGGYDSTDYAREADVNISLDGQANDGQAGENDNVQVERVESGSGNDTLTGNDGENEFYGQAGSDQIRALGGVDYLNGGTEDDFLDGGAGKDDYECDAGNDTALVATEDVIVPASCERTGAVIAGDTATVNKKNRAKVRVRCPAEEGAECSGKLRVYAAGKTVAKGSFKVGAGQTKNAEIKVTKKGKKALKRNAGTLLTTAEASTAETGGTSTQDERVLLQRKSNKK